MSDLTYEDNLLLDWVNGKVILTDYQLSLLVNCGYVSLTQKALAKLGELAGAVHILNEGTNEQTNQA